MKTAALLAILVLLAGALSVSMSADAHAQNDPNILKRIAEQADDQIKSQLEWEYGDSVPSDIQELYEQGHSAVISLNESLDADDVEQAKQDFLSAMSYFKQVTKMISTPVMGNYDLSETPDVEGRDVISELNRLDKYFQKLQYVSEKHDTGIDFSEIQRLFEQARQQIADGDTAEAGQTIQQLKNLIKAIEKNIREYASHSTPDRAKQFVEKQLDRIDEKLAAALEAGADLSQVEQAIQTIEEVRTLMAEQKFEEAKQVLRELIQLVKQIERSVS